VKTLVTTFPNAAELGRARERLDGLSLPYEIMSPSPGYSRVGMDAIVLDEDARMALAEKGADDFISSGWVEYREAHIDIPAAAPPGFDDDVFGEAAIMILAPCVADRTKIRIVAHISGDMSETFPYLNAVMRGAFYNPVGGHLTFMEGYHAVSLYPGRIAAAKADDIVDAWRLLEDIRCNVNGVWARRGEIEPSYEMRQKPPAIEIYKRLPGTNCRSCGERSCLAFAAKLWRGEASPSSCAPVFDGDRAELKDALVEICSALGVTEGVSV
jgi:ArsR family metal-binding transcriptional regulator